MFTMGSNKVVYCPILFCVYIDGLLNRLAYHKIGYNFGTVYTPVFLLMLMTLSCLVQLRLLCIECYLYVMTMPRSLTFCLMLWNPNVCTHHRISVGLLVPCMRPTFYVGGHSVEYVEQWSHLGHIVSADHDDKHDIVNRRNILCG